MEKRKLPNTSEPGAFERLKTAFVAKTPCLEQEFAADVPEQSHFTLEDDADSAGESLDEAGPSTPWNANAPPSEPSPHSEVPSDMLVPEDLVHPRSSAWTPSPKVSAFVAGHLRKPLEKEVRVCLWAECPRPALPGKVATTPEVDLKMATFLQKYVRDPKKGIDRTWKNCQDKLLDMTGPLTKILELAEESKASGSSLSLDRISNWAQRAIVFLGNANCALSTERRRSFLLKVDPKLGDLASSEAGTVAQGGLFVDPFIKELTKFISTFTSLNKAQTSIKKVFHPRVFVSAGRGRGRLASTFYTQGSQRGGKKTTEAGRQEFFQSRHAYRGREGRGRGQPVASTGECLSFTTPQGGGQLSSFREQLENHYLRYLGVADGKGLPDRVLRDSRARHSTQTAGFRKRQGRPYRQESGRSLAERSYSSHLLTFAGLSQQRISCGQDGRRSTPRHKPERVQPVAGLLPLQDGGYSSLTRSLAAQRIGWYSWT